MVHFGLMDFDAGDEEELNLFYLVDSVLDDIYKSKQLVLDDTHITPMKADVNDVQNELSATASELSTSELMDHLEAAFSTYDDSDRSFVSPDNSFQSPGSSYTSSLSYQQTAYIPPSDIPIPDEHFPSTHQKNESYSVSHHTDNASKQEVIMAPESMEAHACYIDAIDLSRFPVEPEAVHNDSVSVSESTDLSRDLEDYSDLIQLNNWTSHRQEVTSQKSTVTSPVDVDPVYPGRYYEDQSNDTKGEFLSWTCKHPQNWSAKEVLDWLFHAAEKNGIDCSRLHAESFRTVSGELLCKMGPDDFSALDPYYGSFFFDLFRKLLSSLQFTLSSDSASYSSADELTDTLSVGQAHQYTLMDHHHHSNAMDNISPHAVSEHYNQSFYPIAHSDATYTCSYDSTTTTVSTQASTSSSSLPAQFYPSGSQQQDWKYENLYNYQFNVDTGYQGHEYKTAGGMPNVSAIRAKYESAIPTRRRPGRPRIKSIPTEEELQAQKEKKLKSQHLWEFVYDLLNNPTYNPSVLKWENQSEGVFRFVQSETVAQLWGTLKCNDNMTYEKLSRAMRHYYKRGILERVEGRRLVYKFSCGTLQRMLDKRANVSSNVDRLEELQTMNCEVSI